MSVGFLLKNNIDNFLHFLYIKHMAYKVYNKVYKNVTCGINSIIRNKYKILPAKL